MTFRADRPGRADRRGPDHLPRPTRRPVARCRRRIVVEALVVVVQLRAEELRDRWLRRRGGRDRRAARGRRGPRLGPPAPVVARGPGRPRRAAAPGARTGRRSPRPTSTACSAPSTPSRSTASRSRSCCAATSTTRPARYAAPRGRRPAPAAADPAAPLGGDDRRSRSCSAAPRSAPPGGPSAAGPPGPSTTWPAAARCRSRPGLPVVVTLLDLAPWELPDAFRPVGRRRGSGSGCGPSCSARRAPSSSAAPAVAQAARRLLHLHAGTDPRGRPRATAGVRGPAGRDAAADAGRPRGGRASGSGWAARALPRLRGPLRRPARPRHAAAGARGARRRGPTRRARCRPSRGRRGSCSSGRARTTGPRSRGRRPASRRRRRSSPTPRRSPRPSWPAWSAAPARRSCPSLSDAAGLAALEAHRGRDAGRRRRRSGALPGAGRAGRAPRRAARRGPARRRARARSGRTIGVHDRIAGGAPRARHGGPARRGPTWRARRGPSTRRSATRPD